MTLESTAARTGMPLAEFIAAASDQPFELLNGERKLRLPTVAGHNHVLLLLYNAILLYLLQQAVDRIIGDVLMEATFILAEPDDPQWVTGSRTPDLSFYAGQRLTQYRTVNPDWKKHPYTLVPDLVAEVVSPGDTVSALDEKVDAYLADGVQLVIVIDPQRRKVWLHTPDQDVVSQLSGDSVLDGGDLLPGFAIPLPDLFI